MDKKKKYDVIIVGGGPVGVSLAIELGQFNINTLLLEQHQTPLQLPKAQTLSARTMEYMMRWGLADEIANARYLPMDYPHRLVWANSFIGEVLAEITVGNELKANDQEVQPYQRLPLWRTEMVLRKHLAYFPSIDFCLQHEVVNVQQDKQGVKVYVERVNETEPVIFDAEYVVGCDGANSVVRDLAGIECEDIVKLDNVLKVVFESTILSQNNVLPAAVLYYIFNNRRQAAFGPIDGESQWYAQIPIDPSMDLSEADIIALIDEICGCHIKAEIVAQSYWQMQHFISSNYRNKRVFLAGDAAHVMAPTGGHGLNTGIGDIMNLAWKLAATIQGWGYSHLLDTYNTERRSIAVRNIAASAVNKKRQLAILKNKGIVENTPTYYQEIAAMAKDHANAKGVDSGYRYEHSAIIINDNTAGTNDSLNEYIPCAKTGHFAPHVYTTNGKSLYDYLSLGFTLLVTEDNVNIDKRLISWAHEHCLPLEVVQLSDSNVRNMYQYKFILIRPDWHVAWRANELPGDYDELFQIVLGAKQTVHV